MRVTKQNQLLDFNDVRSHMNQLMNIPNPFSWLEKPMSFASADIYRLKGELHIDIELPQFSENEITLEQEGNEIRVLAKHTETKGDKKSYLFRESSESLFRSIQIPSDASGDNIEVNFKNGTLKIKMPLLKKHAVKKLSIGSK